MAKPKLTFIDRFLQYVHPEPNTGCWLWAGTWSDSEYGHFWINDGKGGRPHGAHRVAYELFRGPIPEGLELDHLCRVHCCVNPWHLEPVTQQENLRRGLGTLPAISAHTQAAQARTHCRSGHPYTSENTRCTHDGKRQRRICRQCSRIREQRYKRKAG